MKNIFFDESGNSGQNLHDGADPVFVLGSCAFTGDEETELLSCLDTFKGPELKFSKLRKTPPGQRAVLNFLNSPSIRSETAGVYAIHKPFMVVTKYCDLVLEPSFQEAGLDFYARGLNIATANLLAMTMPVYNGLGYEYVRNIIRHGLKQYVVGDCHTNGIESFWALFKRGYHGVYHQMSRKHLQRYLNEFSFRLNRKELEMTEVFSDVVGGIANTDQLPYKVLTA